MKNQKKQNNNFTCRFAYKQDLNTFCDTVGTCPLEFIKMMIMKKVYDIKNRKQLIYAEYLSSFKKHAIDFCYSLKSKI